MSAASPLEGRTAVVTGAARGIGAVTARALVGRGARVALLGLEAEELARTAAALPPGSAGWWAVDVCDEAAMARTAALVRSRFGSPSVVIANAGVAEAGPFLECELRVWRRVVEVNVAGGAVTAHTFLPDLLRTRGYFLQVASLAALGPAPFMSAYCASKAGAEAFARVLRAEVAHRGVGVGVAYLSWAGTEMLRAGDTSRALRALRSALPWPASRTYPVPLVAERLVRGVEHRSASVHAQPWLRGVQLARAALPPLVTARSRRLLRDLERDGRIPATGLLGAGGTAAMRDGDAGGGPAGGARRGE
ncbi:MULTISPECIES: SDR family oxidoreductase [Streptomyces]|nr:SDR family oxidoreductase [Streptomyces sp. NRRL F-5053]